jgi:hypothetical protein
MLLLPMSVGLVVLLSGKPALGLPAARSLETDIIRFD